MYDTLVHDTSDVAIEAEPAPPAGSALASGGVRADGLGKRFGDLWALRDLHLDVARGTVLGLLGHNGAGKTTAIRMLTTLSEPTEGCASVAGFDVVAEAAEVRRRIGVAAQQATVDGLLDARLNLELVGRLHRLPRDAARTRAAELLEQFGLIHAAGRLVKTFSGGMRRRLDLAACLVSHPDVLFLDEPTTGLDPRSREDLWQTLRDLVRDGTTLLLTTQYLEEADRLADHIVVLDQGRTIAEGSPTELKSRIGNDRVEIRLESAAQLRAAAGILAPFASNLPSVDETTLTITAPILAGTRVVDLVRTLDEVGIDVADINRRQATLDDVFLSLTQ